MADAVLVKKIKPSDSINSGNYEHKIKRLAKLQGTDPGFFVLAGQSFLESTLRDILKVGKKNDYNILDLLDYFKEEYPDFYNYHLFNDIKTFQKKANKVRHNFSNLQPFHAGHTIDNIMRFCSHIGLEDLKSLKDLHCPEQYWCMEQNSVQLFNKMQNLEKKLSVSIAQSESLQQQVAILIEHEEHLQLLKAELIEKEAELESVRNSGNAAKAKKFKARNDELRQKVFDLEKKLRGHENLSEEMEHALQYIEMLQDMSEFTRTKKSYEQSIMALSEQQQEVVDKIKDSGDYLVMGAAGTGKTVVLIKAFEKYLQSRERALIGDDLGEAVFLTYTKALVKYGQYLSAIISGRDDLSVSTVDSLFNSLGKKLLPGIKLDYHYFKKNKLPSHSDLPSDLNLEAEIENYILANCISRETYLSKDFIRRGRSVPLKQNQRLIVWNIFEEAKEQMYSKAIFSANMFLNLLLKKIDSFDSPYRKFFIDEVQDLPPVKMQILKKLAKGGLIMSGDASQSIFRPGFTFKQHGIKIVGRSNYLYKNYRNTREIHAITNQYRALNNEIDEVSAKTFSDRPGPPTELFQAKGSERSTDLLDLLISRVKFFINTLGFDPANIAILSSENKYCDKIIKALNLVGFNSARVNEEDFSFEQNEDVVVSTIQSSKGLDFPVVMLYLPNKPYITGVYNTETRMSMRRNLVYVGMTRAMENLQIFIDDRANEPFFDEIRELF